MTESLYNRVEEIVGPRLLDVGKLALQVCDQVQELPLEVQTYFATETARVFRLGIDQSYAGHYTADRTNLVLDCSKLPRTLQPFDDPLGEYFEQVYLQGCVENQVRT